MGQLCTLTEAKLFQSITTDDQDEQQSLYVDLVSNWIETEIGRKIALATYTEYYSGGDIDLLTRQRPVQSVTSIHLDSNGFYGTGGGGFAANTLLTAGEDYALIPDEPGQTWSKSGRIRWRGQSAGDGAWGWGNFLSVGGLLSRDVGRRRGWPCGQGNIKVVYAAGWTESQVPTDLKMGALQFIQTLTSQTDNNRFQPTGESLGPYNYSASQLSYFAREVVGLSSTIRKYREVNF